MPNHVHLILVPPDPDALRRALAPLHRYYAGHVHARQKCCGHFWQGRFGCVAMDEDHLGAALRYVALNPVRARLCKRAGMRRYPKNCAKPKASGALWAAKRSSPASNARAAGRCGRASVGATMQSARLQPATTRQKFPEIPTICPRIPQS